MLLQKAMPTNQPKLKGLHGTRGTTSTYYVMEQLLKYTSYSFDALTLQILYHFVHFNNFQVFTQSTKGKVFNQLFKKRKEEGKECQRGKACAARRTVVFGLFYKHLGTPFFTFQ